MSRRLPTSLAHTLRTCQLYTTGQRCANCPSKGQNECVLLDIEDCLLPQHLLKKPQTSVREDVCSHEETSKTVSFKAIVQKHEKRGRAGPPQQFAEPPFPTGCMRLLAAVPAPAIMGVHARGMKIVGPQKSSVVDVDAGLAEEPLGIADPFEVFRTLRRAHDLEEALKKKEKSAVALSSTDGKILFQEAMASGGMENYFDLAQQHSSQGTNGNSLTCMAMVLNALGHDPKQTWKGLWRWTTPELLKSQNNNNNLDLDQGDVVDFAAFARNIGAGATAFPRDSSELGGMHTFREQLKTVCEDASSPSHLVVHFDRAALGMDGGGGSGGGGHVSPVGGYHAQRDMVLLLDVARSASPPCWVPLPALFRAMSGRGFVRISSSSSASFSAAEKQREDGGGVEVVAPALCPAGVVAWAEEPLRRGDEAWQLRTVTARRLSWQARGRGEETRAKGRGAVLREMVMSKGVDLLVLASAAQRRHEYARA